MRVAFICLSSMLATSLTNAYELCFGGNQVAKTLMRGKEKQLTLSKVANEIGPICLPSGLSISPDQTFDDTTFELIYLPALWRNPKPALQNNTALLEWLRYQYESGAIINATGTGVYFLAETKLLDYRPATTHWHYLDQFARDYPKVELKRQHFITAAGRLYCAASINAQTDLTLHHVHRFLGPRVAQHLSQHFSHEVRQPFDRLSFQQSENTNHPDEEILQMQLSMQTRYSDPNFSIGSLVDDFGMSQRTFSRRFKQATDVTAQEYLVKLRLDEAKELLKHSNLAINEVAFKVGFNEISYFSKVFKENFNQSPREYRKQIRAKLFSSSIV